MNFLYPWVSVLGHIEVRSQSYTLEERGTISLHSCNDVAHLNCDSILPAAPCRKCRYSLFGWWLGRSRRHVVTIRVHLCLGISAAQAMRTMTNWCPAILSQVSNKMLFQCRDLKKQSGRADAIHTYIHPVHACYNHEQVQDTLFSSWLFSISVCYPTVPSLAHG